MPKFRSMVLGASVAAGLGLVASATAVAQGQQQPVVEELIVTAQKREETVQEMAGAISAIGGLALEERGINTVQDLQFQIPNFQAGTGFSTTVVFIRGVGQTVGQPGVATHVDGIYLSRPALVALSQVDLARIEVLRGPQGTLYGRNATAGAVNFISNAPTDRLEGYGRIGAGNFDEWRLQGVVNLPVSDNVRSRLVVDYRNRDKGYIRNVIPGNPDVGAGESLSGRLRTQFDIGERGLFDLVLFAARTEGAHDYLTLRNFPTPTSIAANPYLGDMIVPLEPHRTSANRPSERDSDTYGATGTLTWFLGDVVVRSVTGFYSFEYTNDFDADGTQLDVFPTENDFDSRTFSQELNVSGEFGNVDWLVGGYFMDDRYESDTRYDFPLGLNVPALGVQQIPGAALHTIADPFKTRAYALYADGTWHASERLRVLAGARQSWEKQDNYQTNFSGPLQTPFGLIPRFTTCERNHVPLDFKSFTPRAGIQYDLNDDMNVYGLVSRGFKAGGLNQSNCNNSYNPEKLLAYEAGFKSSLLNGRVTFNATAFYYDYEDFQMNQIVGLSARIINADEATVRGLEFETAWAPTDHWTFNANIALLRSRYGEFTSADGLNPAAGAQDLRGNYLNYSPRASGNLGVQYATGLLDIGQITARAEMYMTSRFYFREFNQRLDSQSGFSRVNLALMWHSPDDRYSARAYVTNATDKAYLSTMGTSDNFGARFVNWGPPRQFGLDVTARF
jgi:iron complex outermembrane recepter protein